MDLVRRNIHPDYEIEKMKCEALRDFVLSMPLCNEENNRYRYIWKVKECFDRLPSPRNKNDLFIHL